MKSQNPLIYKVNFGVEGLLNLWSVVSLLLFSVSQETRLPKSFSRNRRITRRLRSVPLVFCTVPLYLVSFPYYLLRVWEWDYILTSLTPIPLVWEWGSGNETTLYPVSFPHDDWGSGNETTLYLVSFPYYLLRVWEWDYTLPSLVCRGEKGFGE